MDTELRAAQRAAANNPDDAEAQERLAALLARRGVPYKSKRQLRKEAQKDYKPGQPERLAKRAKRKAQERYLAEAKARANRIRLAREKRKHD